MKISKYFFMFISLICIIGLYLFIDIEKDYSKLSMVELQKLAHKEDAEAQGMLAYYFQEGINAEVDYEESLKWYLKSAKNENTSAMVNLAYLYGNGIGVEKDLTKAFKWNLEAANSGDPSAMFNVGKKYENGIGISKDMKKAKYWLEKAEKAKGYI